MWDIQAFMNQQTVPEISGCTCRECAIADWRDDEGFSAMDCRRVAAAALNQDRGHHGTAFVFVFNFKVVLLSA